MENWSVQFGRSSVYSFGNKERFYPNIVQMKWLTLLFDEKARPISGSLDLGQQEEILISRMPQTMRVFSYRLFVPTNTQLSFMCDSSKG